MLGNFWFWSGGFAQYVNWFSGKSENIPYPSDQKNKTGYEEFMNYTEYFYSCTPCRNQFMFTAKEIIGRTNKISNVRYIDDSSIMTWELANEPFPVNSPQNTTDWINDACNLIKAMDLNHMVAIGNTGYEGDQYKESLNLSCIDYGTFHVWPQNLEWYDPKKPEETYNEAEQKVTEYIKNIVDLGIKKPLVLEEFGLARDYQEYFPENSTKWKNRFYTFIFDKVMNYMDQKIVSGVNFWAWAGEGRPNDTRRVWQKGDAWIGDPPHEYQGWYSVYDTDTTVDIIQNFSEKFNKKYVMESHDMPLSCWLMLTITFFVAISGVILDWIVRRPKNKPLYGEELTKGGP